MSSNADLILGLILGITISVFFILIFRDVLLSRLLKNAIVSSEPQLDEETKQRLKQVDLIGHYLNVMTRTRNNLAHMLNFNKELSTEERKELWDSISETDRILKDVQMEVYGITEEEYDSQFSKEK